MEKVWYVYVLECMKDNSLYTGITNDLHKRIKAHEEEKGAKYTKGRGPFIVKYFWFKSSKSEAARHEYEFKQNTKAKKIDIIERLLGVEREGESTEQTRYHPFEMMAVLKKQGWATDGNLDVIDSDNKSTYVLWHKNNKTVYVGNYYLQLEDYVSFPWKDKGVQEENIMAFLKGNIKKAFDY